LRFPSFAHRKEVPDSKRVPVEEGKTDMGLIRSEIVRTDERIRRPPVPIERTTIRIRVRGPA